MYIDFPLILMCFVALGLNNSKMRDRVSLWQTCLTIFGICRLKFVKKNDVNI